MLRGRNHARQAGELAAAILGGAPAETLPVRFDTAHAWIFDSRELERFGWSSSDLPPDAVIRFVTPTYLARHRELIIPAALLFVVAALVIAMLAVMERRQRKAKLALRDEEQRLSIALAAGDAGVFEVRGTTGHASPRWLDLLRASRLDAPDPNAWLQYMTADSQAAWRSAVCRLSKAAGRERLELDLAAEGRLLDVLLTNGRILGDVVGVATDITRQRTLEVEAASRTRLQALGQLAGGIAHDFNNILTVINGTTELLRELDDREAISAGLKEIEGSGARAAELVRRLLLFGRRGHRASRPMDLNGQLRNLHHFFRRLVGETHEVVTWLHDEPLGVPLDTADIDQILSNLIINARDAMPCGGIIHVRTSVETVEGREWAVLTVKDEGVGMDEHTRARVFEPFFTTKPVGDGTGLGLSTVWGIVSSSDGNIDIDSAPGNGTVLTVRWKRVGLPIESEDEASVPGRVDGGTILVVEDDPGVAKLTMTLLDRAGFTTCLATDGREAVEIFRERPDDFDLIFADIVLPHMSGVEMAQRIRQLRPSTRIGFCSGYGDHPSLGDADFTLQPRLLRKPYSQRELHRFVCECLGA